MFIFLRSVYFFRNGFEKNLSFIDKFLTSSYSRFNIFQNKIQNKLIKFNFYKIKINFNNLIKNKYFKYLFSFKYVKKKKKFSSKIIFLFLKLYIQSLKFMYYSIYIDNIDIDIDDYRYNKLNKIFNLLELDSKNLIESLLEKKTKKNEKKLIRYLHKHFKKKQQLTSIFNTKQILYKKVAKNITCFFISETNICDKTYSIYNNIYKTFKFKLTSFLNKTNLNINRVNIFVNLKKNIVLKLDLFYTNIFNHLDILYILPFKYIESKTMLFCLSIFFELIFICFSYIAFFKIEFINIIQICLDIINLYKLEVFSFLELMCIKTFKKNYFTYQLLILSIIRQFLNDNNFLIYFFCKYYNSYSFDIIKYIYSNNFSEIITIFRSSYHMNTFLNSINSSINFAKTFFNDFMLVTCIIYPLNKFLNLNYYFKFFISKFNNIFIKTYNNKVIPISSDDNLDLIRQTPLNFQVSIETLSETVQNMSKRGRPRKLSFYKKGILIEEGVLEPLKPVIENKLGVSYEFVQNNPGYIQNIYDYIEKGDKINKKTKQNNYIEKISGGENYYIKTNINAFSDGPIVFSEESINAALAFASELMLESNMQDSVELKELEKNNIKKKHSGRPRKNSIRTMKIYVSIGRLKSRKYYMENLIKN